MLAATATFAAGAGLSAIVACSGKDGTPPPRTGDATADPRAGGILRGLLDEEPATLDPITPSGGVGNQLAAFVYSRLVRFRPGPRASVDGTVEGDAAERWEQPDESTLIFRLREGMRFAQRAPTNGRALVAEDVVASWDAFASRGTYRTDLANAADKEAPILSLTALDERTVQVKLAVPDAQLLPTLASLFGLWVLPREEFSGGFNSANQMYGSGPWLLERHQPGTGVRFARNPDFYLAPNAPLLDGVDLPIITEFAQAEAQFRARNIHGGPALGGGAAIPPALVLPLSRDLKETRIDLMPPPLIGPTVAFGWRSGSPFRDVRVRQAVSMLIDRDLFIETFTNLSAFKAAGVPMRGYWTTPLSSGWGPYWLDPTSSAFGPHARNLKHDVAEARRLLAAAGHPDGFETPFTFIAGSNWGRDWSTRGEALMAMLAAGGIRCKANPVDYNAVFIPQYLRKAGDFEGMAMQRTGSRGDPGQFWSVFFSATGASTQTGRNFPELDALIVRQRREVDRPRRIALHHEIQRYFAEHLPAVPMGGHTEDPVLAWKGLHGPDTHVNWGGGDLGPEAYPYFWLDPALRR